MQLEIVQKKIPHERFIFVNHVYWYTTLYLLLHQKYRMLFSAQLVVLTVLLTGGSLVVEVNVYRGTISAWRAAHYTHNILSFHTQTQSTFHIHINTFNIRVAPIVHCLIYYRIWRRPTVWYWTQFSWCNAYADLDKFMLQDIVFKFVLRFPMSLS